MTEANSINAATAGIVGNTGIAFTGTAVTAHNLIIGGSTSSTLTNVAPSATSGVPVISQGASADPTFGTAVVAGGGTGSTSFNINGPVISSTTTTGALTSITLTNQKFLVGNTSAAPTAKALSVVRQVFASTGTYTPTSGMVYCDIEVVGGGGGGGSVPAITNVQVAGAGGGGGGGYARGIFSSATIGASQSVTVGAAGAAGTAGGAGGTGGTSSVGSTLLSATGGAGGSAGTAATGAYLAAGGSGGAGSSGDFQTNGSPGEYSLCLFNAAFPIAFGGTGGSTYFGGGAISTTSINGSSVAGNAGTSYGGGGSGAANTLTNTAHDGGAGAKGVVIITEYVIS